MERDTQMGGAPGSLPETRQSVLLQAASPDAAVRERAWDTIAAVYWRPVYKYIRVHWKKSNEDAKDLTQGFFARAIEKEFFHGFDATKAMFRTFLRTCVDGFVANDDKARRALKRGGGARFTDLDFLSAEDELTAARAPAADSMEAYFHDEWVRSVFGAAVDDLRLLLQEQGKAQVFEIFRLYDLDRAPNAAPLTYDGIARELGIDVTAVTNRLASARREFRTIVLAKLRALTASEEEYRDEVRAVLGADPP
jgi:RNA polymerase sigma factor (sigma-70 family)